jgi:acetylornithine deacetylase/succinyl-diaminopimelate desuccinylase-like protein
MLSSPLDTYDPGEPNAWAMNEGKPLSLKVVEGKAYGLGVATGKLDFLCKLGAIRKFREAKLKQPIYLVGTCGSTRGMLGAKYLLQSSVLNPTQVWVGGPTRLSLGIGQKGFHRYQIQMDYPVMERGARGYNRKLQLISRGRTGASALRGKSQNAVRRLVQFLDAAVQSGYDIKFTKLEGGISDQQVPDRALAEIFLTSHQHEDFKRFFREQRALPEWSGTLEMEFGGPGDHGISFLPDGFFTACCELVGLIDRAEASAGQGSGVAEDFEIPGATLSITSIRQSPSRTTVGVDVRVPHGTKNKDIEQSLQDGFRALGTSFPGLHVRLSSERISPEYQLAADDPTATIGGEVLHSSDIEPNLCQLGLGSEAALFHEKSYPAFTLGPGDPVQSSVGGPDENVSLDELIRTQRFYERLIERVCL